MDKKKYRCLFNHELLILVTSQSPYQTYRENVKQEQIEGYIRELKDTAVDAIMCCPLAWKTPMYPSKVDPKWTEEAPEQIEPLAECDWKYYDKIYWRTRRMMLTGVDPLKISIDTAHEIGKDIYISYRMNDHHINLNRDNPTHSRFWRDHPEYAIVPDVEKQQNGADAQLNYLIPEVRDYMKQIVFELIDNYDLDGFELDFMRSPTYFPESGVSDGLKVMTEFVRDIRNYMTDVAEKRGKSLQLCVRVPRNLDMSLGAGLDVECWDKEGLIDMVNVSPYFINAMNCDIEGFKKAVPSSAVYGEMHFITEMGDPLPGGFQNNILRKTSDEVYYATALNFLDRGADGISLFNFDYVRDHSFADPRRSHLPGIEPHFNILNTIMDEDALRKASKNYHVGNSYQPFPFTLNFSEQQSFDIYVGDHEEDISKASECILRLEGTANMLDKKVCVIFNGEQLDETFHSGELFTPFSNEGLPPQERLRFFNIPKTILKHGNNTITIQNDVKDMTHPHYTQFSLKSAELGIRMD